MKTVTIGYKNEKILKKLVFLQDFRFYQWSTHNEKINNLFWKCKFFGYVSFTGKSENLVETAQSFWANEWISKYSDKIMLCKLWGKVTSVSININFGRKMSILCKKKIEILGEMLTFLMKCALLLKVIIFLQNMLIFKTMCQNLITKFNFLGYVNLFMC